MDVLMLGWEYPPNIDGGLGAHFYSLTESLSRQNVGITAVLPDSCTAGSKKNLKFRFAHIEKKGGDYAQFLGSVKRYNQRAGRLALEVMRKEGISLIHAHDWITFKAALWLRKKTGKKLVVTFHSTEYDRNEHADGKSATAKIERAAAKKADGIIAVSKMVKETLVQKYGADEKKVFVIPNAPSIKKFPRLKRKNMALFAGRLASQKGAEYLLGAIPKIKQESKFVFCGDGYLREPLEKYAEMLAVADRVEFKGFLRQDRLARTYSQCSIFISPSVREPFGISLLDAMAAGKPCIATRNTGLLGFMPKEVCITIPEKNPVELAQAINLLLENKELREKLGRNAKLASKKFTWKKTARQTTRVYATITR